MSTPVRVVPQWPESGICLFFLFLALASELVPWQACAARPSGAICHAGSHSRNAGCQSDAQFIAISNRYAQWLRTDRFTELVQPALVGTHRDRAQQLPYRPHALASTRKLLSTLRCSVRLH